MIGSFHAPGLTPPRQATGPVPVGVLAATQLDEVGIVALIGRDPGLTLRPLDRLSQAEVLVVAATRLNGPLLRRIRELTGPSSVPVAAVISQLGEADLLTAVDSGLQGVLWREEATAERFSALIRTVAAGQGDFPREVQSRLLKDLARLQRNVLRPRGLTASGLEEREIAVLALAADGLDTAQIAEKLSCSERTVKNVVSGVLERFNLRNRTHAVAFALRSGLL